MLRSTAHLTMHLLQAEDDNLPGQCGPPLPRRQTLLGSVGTWAMGDIAVVAVAQRQLLPALAQQHLHHDPKPTTVGRASTGRNKSA